MLCAKLCYMNHINYYKTSAAAAASAKGRLPRGLRGGPVAHEYRKWSGQNAPNSSDRIRASSVMRGGIARRGGI